MIVSTFAKSFRTGQKRLCALLDMLALALLGVPAVAPLVGPGYLSGNEGLDTLWNSIALRDALRDRVFLPGWASAFSHGYGLPAFEFQSPLPFYPAVLLDLVIPIGLPDAIKVAFGVDLLLGAAGVYILTHLILGRRAVSLLSALLYTYAPFTLLQVYVRGDLATSTALAILPFCLAVFVRLTQRPSALLAGLAALLVAATVMANVAVGVVACVLAVAMVELLSGKARVSGGLPLTGLAVLLGLGISSVYWLPALGEIGLTHSATLPSWPELRAHLSDPLGDVIGVPISGSGVSPYRITRWGPVDLHPVYPYGPPPYKLSLLQGALLIAAVWRLIGLKKRPALLVLLAVSALLLFVMDSSWVGPVWGALDPRVALEAAPVLLGPLSLCVAVLGSWALLSAERRYPVLLVLVGLAAMLSARWVLPTSMSPTHRGVQAAAVRYEETEPAGTTSPVDLRFLPRSVGWGEAISMPREFPKLYDRLFAPDDWVAGTALLPSGSRGTILATRQNLQWMQALIDAGKPVNVVFHTLYFPGWVSYVDGTRVPAEPSPKEDSALGDVSLGLCRVSVPAGHHVVTVTYEGTEIRRWSRWLAAASILSVGVTLLAAFRPKDRIAGDPRARLGVILAVLVAGAVGFLAYDQLTSQPAPAWVQNHVVLDLVTMAKGDKLSVSTPAGAKATDYVHPMAFTIGGDRRDVLYMQPVSSVSTSLWVPEGARLEFAMALDPAVWDKRGDGVDFQVEVRDERETKTVFSAYVDPKDDPSQRRWIDSSVDLGAFARREVEITLRTLPHASPDYDWAGWATPRIVQ